MTAGMPGTISPDAHGAVLTPVLLRQPLGAAGTPPEVVARWEALLTEAHRALDDAGVPADGRRAWCLPGRIEVLGKHVDYAGGRSLLHAASARARVHPRRGLQRTFMVVPRWKRPTARPVNSPGW